MSTNPTASLSTAWRQLTTSTISSDTISSSPPPSTGNAPPRTPPALQSSEPGTPFSTGYAQDSDSEGPYSPPMATSLLPGAPMSVDLLILMGYLDSLFKQAGSGGVVPSKEQRLSMQDLLIKGLYTREDISAGFLHAVSIVCKAQRAFRVAVAEVAASGEGDVVPEVKIGDEASDFRAAFSGITMAWEDVTAETAEQLQTFHLHRGILQAYGAVAEFKVGIAEVYRRQAIAAREKAAVAAAKAKAKAKVDVDTEMDMRIQEPVTTADAEDDASSVEVETGSMHGKEDDEMEVDSAYEV